MTHNQPDIRSFFSSTHTPPPPPPLPPPLPEPIKTFSLPSFLFLSATQKNTTLQIKTTETSISTTISTKISSDEIENDEIEIERKAKTEEINNKSEKKNVDTESQNYSSIEEYEESQLPPTPSDISPRNNVLNNSVDDSPVIEEFEDSQRIKISLEKDQMDLNQEELIESQDLVDLNQEKEILQIPKIKTHNLVLIEDNPSKERVHKENNSVHDPNDDIEDDKYEDTLAYLRIEERKIEKQKMAEGSSIDDKKKNQKGIEDFFSKKNSEETEVKSFFFLENETNSSGDDSSQDQTYQPTNEKKTLLKRPRDKQNEEDIFESKTFYKPRKKASSPSVKRKDSQKIKKLKEKKIHKNEKKNREAKKEKNGSNFNNNNKDSEPEIESENQVNEESCENKQWIEPKKISTSQKYEKDVTSLNNQNLKTKTTTTTNIKQKQKIKQKTIQMTKQQTKPKKTHEQNTDSTDSSSSSSSSSTIPTSTTTSTTINSTTITKSSDTLISCGDIDPSLPVIISTPTNSYNLFSSNQSTDCDSSINCRPSSLRLRSPLSSLSSLSSLSPFTLRTQWTPTHSLEPSFPSSPTPPTPTQTSSTQQLKNTTIHTNPSSPSTLNSRSRDLTPSLLTSSSDFIDLDSIVTKKKLSNQKSDSSKYVPLC